MKKILYQQSEYQKAVQSLRGDRSLRSVWHAKIAEFEEELIYIRRARDKAISSTLAQCAKPMIDDTLMIVQNWFDMRETDARQQLRKFQFLLQLTSKRQGKTLLDPAVVKMMPLDQIFITSWQHCGQKRKKALCPFHNEDTPSFIWYTEQNKWHCFGCSFGGDVIDFVMRRDKKTFNEAMALLNQ